MKSKSAQKIKLTSYDELFGSENGKVKGEYTTVPLSMLRPFKNHPFRVLDDEKMQETVESIKQQGVIQPGIVRPCAEGYEVVAGHRRWRACELAGLEEMPVIVRKLDDDAATVLMVDTNIQRENLLPSEKARAYKMKYDAMKHQGRMGDKHTADAVGEKAGDSGRTVQRYIRLVNLDEELLNMLDAGKITMVAAERLSFLGRAEQLWLLEAVNSTGICPTSKMAEEIKETYSNGTLDEKGIYIILTRKAIDNAPVTISVKRIRNYFPVTYTKAQIEEVIFSLLDQWKQQKEERQDAGTSV